MRLLRFMAAWVWLMAGGVCAAQAGPDAGLSPPAQEVTWRWGDSPIPQPLWQVQFQAEAWYAAPSGDIRLPGSPVGSEGVSLADLNLDSPVLGPGGVVRFQRGAWRLRLRGVTNDLENSATADSAGQIGTLVFARGDRLDSSLRLSTVEGTVGRRIFEARRGGSVDGGHRFVFGLDGFVGARAYGFEMDIAGPAGSTGVDEWFGEVVAGAEMDFELWRQVSVDLSLEAGIGGGPDDRRAGSGDIAVGFEWRPGAHVGVRLGYRLGLVGLNAGDGEDEFEFRGTQAGLVFGVGIRF